jgi:hypothetical protein
MKTIGRTMMLTGALTVGVLGFGAAPARAQAVGFGYAGPGMSFGFTAGGYGYGGYGYGGYGYPAPVMGGYAGVVGGPVVMPRPVIVPGPVIMPRGYYGGFYRGGPYYGGHPRRWR